MGVDWRRESRFCEDHGTPNVTGFHNVHRTEYPFTVQKAYRAESCEAFNFGGNIVFFFKPVSNRCKASIKHVKGL